MRIRRISPLLSRRRGLIGLAIYDDAVYKAGCVNNLYRTGRQHGCGSARNGTKESVLLCPSRVMLHQPIGGAGSGGRHCNSREGNCAGRTISMKSSKHSGQDLEVIARDTDRNFYMSAEEARAYGLIDEILTKRE